MTSEYSKTTDRWERIRELRTPVHLQAASVSAAPIQDQMKKYGFLRVLLVSTLPGCSPAPPPVSAAVHAGAAKDEVASSAAALASPAAGQAREGWLGLDGILA